MEDAYLIGIRLALDDGVSAGVAAIRQDLAALDSAITNTTAHLRQLQEIAAQTTGASVSQPSRPVPPPSVQPQPMPESQTTPNAPAIGLPAGAPTNSALPPPLQSPEPSPVKTQIFRETPSTGNTAAPQSTINAIISPPPERPTASVISPVTIPPPQLAPVITSSAGSPAQPSTQVPGQPRPAIKIINQSSAPIVVQPDRERPNDRTHGLVGGLQVPPDSASLARRPVAPQPGEMTAPSVPPQTQTAPISRPIAPQTSAAQSGPVSGDVYLDGTRLGHWLATSLGREASRPPAGSTSFDPRLGVSWPGAQQGGG